MKKVILLSVLTLMAGLALMAQPKNVAHRGFWRTEGSAQNSITSLQKAHEAGCYGSEFDVWITTDGVPVVTHDAVWDGTRIEDTSYPELQFRQLDNGEFLPTLQQYLQMGKKIPDMQLIMEIKTHKTDERNDKAVDICVDLVKRLGLESQVEYIAFSRRVCKRLYELTPGSKIAYLAGDLSPREAKDSLHCNGIDYNEKIFLKHPEWLREAEKERVEVNVWTVDGEENLRRHSTTKGIDIITTNDPTILSGILSPNK